MASLREFLSPEAGQKRRAWLDETLDQYVAKPLNYYLGPTGVPGKMQNLGEALEYTDAGDMPAAAEASRNLWNNPTLGNAAEMTAAGIALGLPMYSQRMGEGIANMADELVQGYDPNTLNAFRVWHGSPHDFDRFSMDKIGTGEGAQIDGRGLYFSDYEVDAGSYRKPDARMGMVGQKSRFSGDGTLYEVGIDAEPSEFLDARSPVRDLPNGAQEAVKKHFRQDDEFADQRNLGFYIRHDRDVEGDLAKAGFPGLTKKTYSGDSHFILFDDTLATILSKNGKDVGTPEADRMRKEIARYLAKVD
jgi:hypothetical protein